MFIDDIHLFLAGRLNIIFQSIRRAGLVNICPRVRCIRQQQESQRTSKGYTGNDDDHQKVRKVREIQSHLKEEHQ